MIKHIYRAEIVFFGKSNLKDLISCFDFIDEFEEIPSLTSSENPIIKEKINKYNLDFIISFHAKTFILKFLINTNAKKVITRNRPISIFSLKCKCVFVSFIKRFYKNRNDEFKMLYYARKINPKLFDKEIKNLNFDIKIKTNIYNKNIINNFLDQNNIKDKNLILLNPFSISAFYTLKLVDYLRLCQEIISKFKDIYIIIPSYEAVHKDFIREFKTFFKENPQRIYIFKNDDNILNICELIKRTKCVISPSTGVIHLASNLEKSSIGLFSEKDIIFWETFNKDYVLLNKTKEELSTYDILEIINEILLKLKRYL